MTARERRDLTHSATQADNQYHSMPIIIYWLNFIDNSNHSMLLRYVSNAALLFFRADETRLRAKGYDKTPDFILQVPIGKRLVTL
jgi:hypothetical protein